MRMPMPGYWKDFRLEVNPKWDRSEEVILPETGTHPGPVKAAWIPEDHALFKSISSYVEQSVTNLPYKSASFEGARMQAAKNSGMLFEKLKEKKPIVCPCSFAGVSKIKLLVSEDLWDQYAYMRSGLVGRKNNLDRIRWSVPGPITTPSGVTFPIQDKNTSESWLFHGTGKETMKLIGASGFNPEFCRFRGKIAGYGALGKGVYFSDCFSKIATYTNCKRCGSFICKPTCKSSKGKTTLRSVFLCRVLLGNIDVNLRKNNKIRAAYPSNVDSVYGPSKRLDAKSSFGMNEFAVNGRGRTYPEFVIYYRIKNRDSRNCSCFS